MVYFDEPGQAELVHGVDVLQLHDAEEQDGRVLRDRPVAVTGLDRQIDR